MAIKNQGRPIGSVQLFCIELLYLSCLYLNITKIQHLASVKIKIRLLAIGVEINNGGRIEGGLLNCWFTK